MSFWRWLAVGSLLLGVIVFEPTHFVAQEAVPPEAEPQASPPLPVDTLPAEFDLTAIPLGLALDRRVPLDNQLTPQRVALGRKLFFEPRLSKDESVSCASCHLPDQALAGTEDVSVGIQGQRGRRNAPSVFNTAYRTSLFWDGRALTLEEQALQPIENPVEMGAELEVVVQRLREDEQYRVLFREAYGGEPSAQDLAKALASFQRVLLSGDHPVDRFRAGQFTALTEAERNGMWIFESNGGCWRCHKGGNLSDEGFHNTGVSWGQTPLDLGRFELSDDDRHRGQFKTPSLRSVALTAPYMHDGSLKNLREVVEFYNRGGGKNPGLDPLLKPLNLTDREVEFLVAYLESLKPAPGPLMTEPSGD